MRKELHALWRCLETGTGEVIRRATVQLHIPGRAEPLLASGFSHPGDLASVLQSGGFLGKPDDVLKLRKAVARAAKTKPSQDQGVLC